MKIGKKIWAIAEGFIPSGSTGSSPDMMSHETACVLNTNDEDTELRITIFYKDREPAGPFIEKVKARRTKHLRFDKLSDPESIPKDTDYSALITSTLPIVVQHTRLDSRQSENALMTTTGYSE